MESRKDNNLTFKVVVSSLVVVGLALFFSIFFVLPKLLSGPEENVCVKSLDGEELNFSDFLLATTLKVNEAEGEIQRNFGDELTFDDLKESQIKGMSAIEYIKDTAASDLNHYLILSAAAKKKLNLAHPFTKEEYDGIKGQAYQMYKSFNINFNASNIGISKSAFENYIKYKALEQKILKELFGEGKSKEVKDEEMKNFAKDKNKFCKYQIIKLSKSMENLKVKDCKKEDKKEGEDKKDKEKKKEDDKDAEELILEKVYGVKTVDELANKLFDSLKNKKLSWGDLIKKFNENFGTKSNFYVENENTMFLDSENESQDFMDSKEKRDAKKNEIKSLKENEFKIVNLSGEKCLLIRLPINEKILDGEEGKNIKEKIKKKIEDVRKKQFFDEVEKENIEKIETDDNILNSDNTRKQLKKVYKYKKRQDPLF